MCRLNKSKSNIQFHPFDVIERRSTPITLTNFDNEKTIFRENLWLDLMRIVVKLNGHVMDWICVRLFYSTAKFDLSTVTGMSLHYEIRYFIAGEHSASACAFSYASNDKRPH